MFSKLFGSCFQKRNGRRPPAKSTTPSEDATETDGSYSRSQSHSRNPRTADNEPGPHQLEDLKPTKPTITTSNEKLGRRKGPKGIANLAVGNAPELESVVAYVPWLFIMKLIRLKTED